MSCHHILGYQLGKLYIYHLSHLICITLLYSL